MLKLLQEKLPGVWTQDRYSKQFRESTSPYKDFQHAHLHLTKATNKLLEMIEQADHSDDPITQFKKGDVAKYIADLVICATRLALTNPSGPIDLEAAIAERFESKMGVPLTKDEKPCIRCGWNMQKELGDGWASASRSLCHTQSGVVCSHCLTPKDIYLDK